MENSKMGCNTKEKMAPATPPLRSISSFQVLQKTTYGDAADSSSSPPQVPNENIKVENLPSRNDSTSIEQNMLDPKKLRRIMSNRLSAKRSRVNKLRSLANLEIQAKTFEDQIAKLQPQQASYQNQKQNFMMEQQTLDQEMEVLQKETLLTDAEIEKNKKEMNRLRELQVMQQEQLQAQLLNWNIGLLKPVSNDPISNYHTNSYQGSRNGEETSHIPAVPNMHETNLSVPKNTWDRWRRII